MTNQQFTTGLLINRVNKINLIPKRCLGMQVRETLFRKSQDKIATLNVRKKQLQWLSNRNI